jgi:hypothetical protein
VNHSPSKLGVRRALLLAEVEMNAIRSTCFNHTRSKTLRTRSLPPTLHSKDAAAGTPSAGKPGCRETLKNEHCSVAKLRNARFRRR